MQKLLSYTLLAFVLLTACSDNTIITTPELVKNTVKPNKQKYINAVTHAAEYFKAHCKDIPVLAERNYNHKDIKYGLALCWDDGIDIGLQFPIIKGDLTTPRVLHNITKQNRDFLYITISLKGEIKHIYLVNESPIHDYYEKNRMHIRYQDFSGTKNIYNFSNVFSAQLSLDKGIVAQTRSITDSIFELPEVIINGVDIKEDHFYNGYCQFCKQTLIYNIDYYSMYCPQCYYNLDDNNLSDYCLATGSWTIVKGFLPTAEDKHAEYEERNTCALQVITNIINFFANVRIISAGQILMDYCGNRSITLKDFMDKINSDCGLKMGQILDILKFLTSENHFDYYHLSNEIEAKETIEKQNPVFATFESNVVDSVGQSTSHAVTLYGYDANGNFCFFDSTNGTYDTRPCSDFDNYIIIGKY